jgi:hypothetical protein
MSNERITDYREAGSIGKCLKGRRGAYASGEEPMEKIPVYFCLSINSTRSPSSVLKQNIR